MRGRRVPAGVPSGPPERRVGERERAAARRLLSAAAAEDRFGSSDELERRLERVAAARTRSELAAVVGDLDRLVPSDERRRILGVIARAHAADELDYAEFLDRTDRALPALTYEDAGALVADLGEEVVAPVDQVRRAGRRQWRPAVRRHGLAALTGGLVGAGAVALPVAVALPSALGAWVPVVALTGAFSAAGTVAAAGALRWRQRLGLPAVVPGAQPGARPCDRK